METQGFQKIYTKLSAITKATVTLKAEGAANDELATVAGRLAQVVKVAGDSVTLQVFSGTEGIPTDAEVVFLHHPPMLKVSDELAGRFFNAYGEPLDGAPIEGEEREIGGPTVNPYKRKQPSELIATGTSVRRSTRSSSAGWVLRTTTTSTTKTSSTTPACWTVSSRS